MPTLIYTPEVKVYISTDHHGIIDVSEDLVDGTMVRRSDGVSTFDFTLMNARRKYDLKFTPNDRIVVLMKRVTWLHVFTGYLNSVPLRTAWPRDVPLSASCSLKRLQYFYWDPYSSAAQALIIGAFSQASSNQGAGVTGILITDILTNVVRWPKQNIHLGEIPADWFQLAVNVARDVKQWSDDAIAQVNSYFDTIGASGVIGGSVTDRIRTALGLDNGTGSTNATVAEHNNGSATTTNTPTVPASTGGFAGTWKPQDASSDPNHLRVGMSDAGLSYALPAAGNAHGILKPGTYGGVPLNQAQLDVAARIYEIMSCTWTTGGGLVQLPNNVLWAAMCAAKGESGFNPSAANNKANPGHTGPGGSSAYGVFQLLDDKGSLAQRGNVDYSTNWWVNQLFAKYGANNNSAFINTDPGAIALKVEVSNAPPSYYGQYTPMAKAIVTEINKAIIRGRQQRNGAGAAGLGGGAGGATNTTPKPHSAGAGAGSAGSGASGKRVATGGDFTTTLLRLVTNFPHIPYALISAVDFHTPPSTLDCSSLVQWGVFHTLGALHGVPRIASAQAAYCTKRLSAQDALNIPGALVFLSTNGQASGVHHVEVSIGNGKDTVGAHHPGSPAGVEGLGASYWSFGGLLPVFTYPGEHAPGIPQPGTTSNPPVHSGGTRIWPTHDHKVDVGFRQKSKKGAADDDWYTAWHTGVDFVNVKYGDPVVSVAKGKVHDVSGAESGQYGTYVSIVSGNVLHLYAHLSAVDPAVSVGATVKAGQKIGEVGNSGQVLPLPTSPSDHKSGVHLHFEVRKAPFTLGDSRVLADPVQFITHGLTVASPTTSDGSTTAGQVTTTSDTTSATALATTYSKSETFDPSSPIDQLFSEQVWYPGPTDAELMTESNSLVGAYTLANDTTVLQYLMQLCASSMRSFCSAPNGDFIAWFPDYYGLWGTAAVLQIEDIELQDFNVNWSDDNFVTHQFVQQALSTALDPGTGLVDTSFQQLWAQSTTAGVANIDSPAVMAALFGFPPENAEKFASYIYQKFGARPNTKRIDAFMSSKSGEFFMALFYFMLQWAYQYQASIPITFMPEAWPGMLIQVRSFNFQAYITSVTHTFQFGEGGSFGTQINIAAPALLEGGGKKKGDNALIGLPLAGGYGNTQGLLTAANQPAGDKPSIQPPTTVHTGGVQTV